jgi:bacteriocin leader peptide (microcyclamide/patellamide family)
MDKQNLMPIAAQPVNRSTTGQLPDVLAELSEEALQLHGDSDAAVIASFYNSEPSNNAMPCYCRECWCTCSYDGDDAE